MLLDFSCPNCGLHLKLAESWAGRVGTCPKCKTEVRVPAAPTERSSPLSARSQCPQREEPLRSPASTVPDGEPRPEMGRRAGIKLSPRAAGITYATVLIIGLLVGLISAGGRKAVRTPASATPPMPPVARAPQPPRDPATAPRAAASLRAQGGEQDRERAPRIAERPQAPAPTLREAASLQAQGGQDNLQKALRIFERLAADGNAAAMFEAGKCYDRGLGVATDKRAARAWFEKAADAGNFEAMNRLGVAYRDLEFGFPPNETPASLRAKAAGLFMRAAAGGESNAMLNLAKAYSSGDGIPQDWVQAFRWYDLAIRNGQNMKMKEIADIYFKRRNPRTALGWYERAAEAGEPIDMQKLAEGYERVGETSKALPWFQKAAEAGNVRAMVHLGQLYERGRFVPRDYGMAAGWYKRGAAAGNREALYKLGSFYEWGLGVRRNLFQAMRLYEKAAELGDARAMFDLGRCYKALGRLELAQEWFERSEAAGYAQHDLINNRMRHVAQEAADETEEATEARRAAAKAEARRQEEERQRERAEQDARANRIRRGP